MNEKSTKSSIVFSDHWLEDEVVFGLRASTTVLNLKLDVPSDFQELFVIHVYWELLVFQQHFLAT